MQLKLQLKPNTVRLLVETTAKASNKMNGRHLRFLVGSVLLSVWPAFGQDEPTRDELMKMELIPFDLNAASRTMTVYDRDDSRSLEKIEYERLPWRDDALDFDIDKNGELTHLEVGVRQAFLRSKAGITEIDVGNANTFLSRHDKNRNGQLDPNEIEESGWPTEPDEFDTNRDGVITKQELLVQLAFDRGLRVEMGIEGVDQGRALKMIGRFDADGDKKLDESEYGKAPIPKPGSEFDEDGDKKLSSLELATMYAVHRRDKGLSHYDVKKVQGIFAQHDRDGDGRIPLGPDIEHVKKQLGEDVKEFSFAESPVTNRLKGQLGKFDSNNDNVVTIAEVENRLAEVRKRLGYAQAEYQKAQQMITRYDSNRSKYIEEHELDAAVQAGQLPKNLFEIGDKNKDGRINQEELSAHFGAKK